jgi:hypothetical protein
MLAETIEFRLYQHYLLRPVVSHVPAIVLQRGSLNIIVFFALLIASVWVLSKISIMPRTPKIATERIEGGANFPRAKFGLKEDWGEAHCLSKYRE